MLKIPLVTNNVFDDIGQGSPNGSASFLKASPSQDALNS